MTHEQIADEISGAAEVTSWFGRWPAFHDAEISKFQLIPDRCVVFSVYAWNMTSEVDEKGYYRNEKHADLEFRLEEVTAVNIVDLTEVGVLFGLDIRQENDTLSIILDASYGIHGTINCARCSVNLKPR